MPMFRYNGRRKPDDIDKIIEALKKNPDVMYVSDTIIMVYMPSADKVMALRGDFRNISPERANQILIERFTAMMAKLN